VSFRFNYLFTLLLSNFHTEPDTRAACAQRTKNTRGPRIGRGYAKPDGKNSNGDGRKIGSDLRQARGLKHELARARRDRKSVAAGGLSRAIEELHAGRKSLALKNGDGQETKQAAKLKRETLTALYSRAGDMSGKIQSAAGIGDACQICRGPRGQQLSVKRLEH
jgi:hypothetical protein